jgi:hypothetical protein
MNSEPRTPNFEPKVLPHCSNSFRLALLILVLVLLFLSGCAHLSPDLTPLNVSPLFHIQTNPERQARRVDGIGPFYSQSESPEEREWTFRPFFSYRENKKENTEEWEYLYPLGRYKKNRDGIERRFIPFYSSFTPNYSDELRDPRDNVDLFPVFWGKDKEGRSYGGLFPFGGTFRGRFTRDEINFVLWPIYTRVVDGETQTYNILWPIFSFTSGGDRQGFRVWPIVGNESKEGMGAYEKSFFLWPIFHYQKRDTDTDNPKTYFYVFPLYLSERSSNEQKNVFLFPFFSFYFEKNFNYHQIDFPWPVIQFSGGEDMEGVRFWPLMTYRRDQNKTKMSIAWPIFIQEKYEDDKRDEVLNRVLFFSKIDQIYHKQEDRWERDTKIWPLFRYAEDGLGKEYFYFPALMPADWEGLERNYGMLFRVYEYYKDGKGRETSKFLWGLYYHQKEKESERIEVSFLFTYLKGKDSLQVSFLKGLVGYERDGPKRQMRILYLPISLEEKEDSGKLPESPPAE